MNAADFSVSDPEQFRLKAFYKASRDEHACFLDSNAYTDPRSSFDSLIARGARSVLQPEENCFEALRTFLDETPGWKLGFLGYDLKNEVERLVSQNSDPLDFPSLYFFVPRELVILKGSSTRIMSETSPSDVFREIQEFPLPAGSSLVSENSLLTPGAPVFPRIRQRVGKGDYLEAVSAIRRHIIDGDVYELNYCIDFYADEYECDPAVLFARLNAVAPAPFASFLRFGDRYILCASPERFLKKTGSRLVSQPIKGTMRRSSDVAEDEKLKAALGNSEKEKAENVMIVDLVRNDLSRSAVPGSVRVSELFGIHTFRHWHQMISTVEADARPGIHPVEIIRNAFPMGSMTGAPKVMAMKLIDHYEQVKRSAFSGAIGYFSPEGDFDLNVVIRSMLYNGKKKYLSFPVGGAITYDSVPENEYEECLLKAKAIRSLFHPA